MAKGQGLSKSKFLRGLVVGGAAAVVGLALLFTGALEGIEDSTWDLRVKWFAAPSPATDDIVLILVDQDSLDTLIETNDISWPWPRSVYSYIVDFCELAGVASLTFDLILQDQGWAGPYDDNALLYAAERLERFVYAVELGKNPDDPNDWPEFISRPDIQISGQEYISDETLADMQFDRGVFPHIDLTASNALIGFVNGDNDDDGVYRHYRLVNFHLGEPVPSLALAAYAAFAGKNLEVSYGRNSITVDGTTFPVDNDGDILLKYTTPGDLDYLDNPEESVIPMHTHYYAWDIIESVLSIQQGQEPVIDPAELEGKYVLFGLSASGLFDLRPTSVDPRAPGVTVHATMLDNLLSGEVMSEVPIWASAIILVMLTLAGALAATYASRVISEVLLILLFLAVPMGFAFGGFFLGFWLPMVVLLVTVFLAMIAANVANYATEGAARRAVRDMFGRYLSPDVISELEEDPGALQLGGKQAEITIFFSDIQKFSTISTKLNPHDLVEFLNVYLTPMTNAILEEGGLIDKYEGDAIIAMWGAPQERTDHAPAGLRSLIKCQAALDELRPRLKEQIGTDVYQRIGMSTGYATVGNMGSELRRDYTMIGDAVNLAARLEGANKAFGTYSMVSQDTVDSAGGLEVIRNDICPIRELGLIAVVGREDKPTRVYEPMQLEDYRRRSGALAEYDRAVKLFQAGQFNDAREIFVRIAEADPAAASYVPRCDTLMKNPPADWNGVWVLTEKG